MTICDKNNKQIEEKFEKKEIKKLELNIEEQECNNIETIVY